MILILDDHPIARQGLCSVLHTRRPEEPILQAGTVWEAEEKTRDAPVTMAFIDLKLGRESGFDYLEWLNKTGREVKTFLITSSSDPADFQRAKRLGVDAYVLKDAFLDEIAYGVAAVTRGGKFYSAAMVDSLDGKCREQDNLKTLTDRETQVLSLLAQGCGNRQIGGRLYISEGTVKKHISSILSKLGLHNRVEAVLFASRNREETEDARSERGVSV
ncbi:MAG: response regulator transcription factor [Clostridiales bacterium]|nr:response regulator transcription factor [Clostridiales bacterium]